MLNSKLINKPIRNKWNSDARCLDWAEHEAMLTHTSIRRRPDIRKDRKKGVDRFVIADLINAFGAYETLNEVENAWSTIKTILAPTRIHVECVWEERFVDCCTIADFFQTHHSAHQRTRCKPDKTCAICTIYRGCNQ